MNQHEIKAQCLVPPGIVGTSRSRRQSVFKVGRKMFAYRFDG
jgi:hypothetical protein